MMDIPIALQAWILKEDFFDGMRSRQSIQNWAERQLSRTQDPSDELLDLSSDRKKSQNHLNSLLSSFIDPSVLSWQSTEILFGVIGKRFFDKKSGYDDCICNLFQMTEFVFEFQMHENIKDMIVDMYEIVEMIHLHNMCKNFETRRQMKMASSSFNDFFISDEPKEIEKAENMLMTFITPYVELLGDRDFSL